MSRIGRIAHTGLTAAVVLAMVGPATANDADVIREGQCSGASDWKLKLSPEDGRLEVEFEVDQNRVGQEWLVRLERDGNRFFQGTRTTRPPSGSFEVNRVISNGPGRDRVTAWARNLSSGEVCQGAATF
jgi:catechol 2,3-dioxygenase-like lactoylglutathione lyase family enzyme